MGGKIISDKQDKMIKCVSNNYQQQKEILDKECIPMQHIWKQ